MDFGNETMSESLNEGYVTAEEDSTRYLSVLESTGEITLDDLNITLQNAKVDEHDNVDSVECFTDKETEELSTVDINGQQVVVFTVDGRDELYGLQFVQDEQGNLQKCQFELRTNEDGQLEPIAETVQLLPLEDDISTVVQQEGQSEETYIEQSVEDFADETLQNKESDIVDPIATQGLESDEIQGDINQEYEESDLANLSISQDHAPVDTKSGILDNLESVKQEMFSEDTPNEDDEEDEEDDNCGEMEHFTPDNIYSSDRDESELQHLQTEATNISQYNPLHESEDQSDSNVTAKIVTPYEEIFVEERPNMHNEDNQQIIGFISQNIDENEGNNPEVYYDQQPEEANFDNGDNDSDNDDYHIVEGLHVTGDMEEHVGDMCAQNIVAKESAESEAVLKNTYLANTVREVEKKDVKTVLYYVIRHPEKENLDSVSIINPTLCKPAKSNPRSVLKSSHTESKKLTEPKVTQSERFNKRFSRSKEAIEERLFMNFINRTTIPVEPVRNHRLPRKQKIKPIKRMDDEEIIVQEVFVSSNGFVETLEDGVLKSKEPLKVTETVTLSDSDDDYDPKLGKKKKHKLKKYKQKVPITISDTTDSEDSVIEVYSESGKKQEDFSSIKTERKGRGRPKKSVDAEGDIETKLPEVSTFPAKRGRGRPPKSSKTSNLSSQEDSESPAKKSRTDDSEDSPPAKNEISCPECTKSFASQNSLKTHIQHHNLEKNLRKVQNNSKSNLSGAEQDDNRDDGALDTNCVTKLDIVSNVKKQSETTSTETDHTDKTVDKLKINTNPKGSIKLHNSIRENTSMASTSSTIIYKHKCADCNAIFKNSILLSKHSCLKKSTSSKYDCPVCHKLFTDISKFNLHKRLHIKENLVKTTSTVKVSPKKNRMSSIPTFKSPKNYGIHKCTECGKVSSSLAILTAHQKTHKQFRCPTCLSTFASRILLDTHIREKCIIKKSPQNKRLSFKIKKSFVQSPKRASTRYSARSSTRRSSVSSNTSIASSTTTTSAKLTLHLKCKSCDMKFSTYAKLFDHQVLQHGLNTPDKENIVDRAKKKSTYQQKETFGGVPASAKLTSAYAKLKSKFDLG